MTAKEKLAVWLLSASNPVLGRAATYPLWNGSAPAKQRYGAKAAINVFIVYFILMTLASLLGVFAGKV